SGSAAPSSDSSPWAADFATTPREERPDQPRRRPLDHWTDAELERAGFDEAERTQLRALQVAEDALGLLETWPDDRVDMVLDMIEQTPDAFFSPTVVGDDEAAEERLRTAISRFGALAGLSPLFDE